MIIASLGRLDITTGSSDRERCGNPIESSLRGKYDVELNISWCGKSDLNSERYLNSLKKLFASHNNFHKIRIDFFCEMPRLIEVDLSHNKIDWIDPRAFERVRNLETIDLSYNQIRSVAPATFYTLFNLNKLNLGYNKFDSDPNILIRFSIWCKCRIFCRCFSIPQIILDGNPRGTQITSTTTTSKTANGTVLIPNGNDLLGLKPKQLLLICISLTAVLGTIMIILGMFYLLIPIYNHRKRMVVRKMTPTPPPIMMQRRRAAPNHYVI